MGRKRTHLRLSASERRQALQLLKSSGDPHQRERLQVTLWADTGEHTLEDLARMAGRSRATIQLWLDKFRRGRVNGLLKRDTPPGSTSPLSSAALQAEIQAGLRSKRWRTASDVAKWLRETHDVNRARKSIYYWFKKMGWSSGVGAKPSVRNSRLVEP